jgi:hypothetical protein
MPNPIPNQVFGLVKAHLKQFEAKNYTCVTGDNSVVLADDDDGKEEQALVQITSLFPELCQQLRLPYMVERNAEEIYSGWHKHGTRTALPQTIAAAAIWSASRQLAADLRETMGIELTMADLTKVAGVAEGTIAGRSKVARAWARSARRRRLSAPAHASGRPSPAGLGQSAAQAALAAHVARVFDLGTIMKFLKEVPPPDDLPGSRSDASSSGAGKPATAVKSER